MGMIIRVVDLLWELEQMFYCFFFLLQQQNVGLGISNLYVLEVCLFFIRG